MIKYNILPKKSQPYFVKNKIIYCINLILFLTTNDNFTIFQIGLQYSQRQFLRVHS